MQRAPVVWPQIRPKSFVTLPEALARERDRVECMTFMGLLPEIDHAWMTVDNVLYLWNYHTQDFTQFRDLEQARPTTLDFSRKSLSPPPAPPPCAVLCSGWAGCWSRGSRLLVLLPSAAFLVGRFSSLCLAAVGDMMSFRGLLYGD